jgi:general secretion pathway protein G
VQQRVQQRLRAVREGQGGFTLIELLIVIVVLGVLAGIAVFAVGNFRQNATQVACQTDQRSVETAVEAYRAANAGNNPPDGDLTDGTLAYAALVPEFLAHAPANAGYTINLTGGDVIVDCNAVK